MESIKMDYFKFINGSRIHNCFNPLAFLQGRCKFLMRRENKIEIDAVSRNTQTLPAKIN